MSVWRHAWFCGLLASILVDGLHRFIFTESNMLGKTSLLEKKSDLSHYIWNCSKYSHTLKSPLVISELRAVLLNLHTKAVMVRNRCQSSVNFTIKSIALWGSQ